MSFPGNLYASPGVYTRTNYDNPTVGLLQGLKIPVFIGPGSESLSQTNLELVRGSSATVDQHVVGEDVDGRMVAAESDAGAITLGAFDGVRTELQVRNFPIVKGNGTGTTATSTSSVSVTLNDDPVVVLSMVGALGRLTLAVAPLPTDTVRVTYFYNRTDTSFTDDLSDQITAEAPILYGNLAESYVIEDGESDELLLTVDGVDLTITLTASSTGWTAAQVSSQINSQAGTTDLVAAVYQTHQGTNAISLTASNDIVVGAGTANSVVGFTAGTDTARNKTFYVFNQPIVDGTHGGITTTDTSDVTVKVNGVQVIPTSLNGASGAFLLAQAPANDATVTATYFHNTYQDTFDYLAHNNVTEITQCGYAPGRVDFTDEADFVLTTKNGNSIIMWGTAVTVVSGTHTTGSTYLTNSQVTPTLVDTRAYLAACAPVTNGSVSPPVTSQLTFTLPHVPTTGNGRNSLLGSSLFQSVSNNRIDLPTNRPDLVLAYWGYGVQDAIERGAVTVTAVDSANSQITLASKVPPGATVYATYYYNTMVDQEYTLTVTLDGPAGVGSYAISDEAGDTVFVPQFGSKSSGLSTITLAFPSGSERTPDVRFETPTITTDYTGPVAETVTVTIKNVDGTQAKWTAPNPGPYYFVSNASDQARIQIDGSDIAGSAGHDLTNNQFVSGLGFFGTYLGDEVAYDEDAGTINYTVDSSNNGLSVVIDDVEFLGTAEIATSTAAAYVTALNRPTQGEDGTAQAGAAGTLTLAAGASATDDYYVGWTIVLSGGTGTDGDSLLVTAYNGTTKVATMGGTWAVTPDNTTTYKVFDPDARPKMTTSGRFTSSVDIVSNEYDKFILSYVGNVEGSSGSIPVTIAAATYASASALASAIQTAINTALSAENWAVACSANSKGELVFTLTKSYADETGYLEFITHGTPAQDFCVIAGISTASAGGAQTKLIDGAVAKRFTVTGNNTSALLHDRIMLRNRIIPGTGSISGHYDQAQCQLLVQSGTGNTQAGLVANETAEAGFNAVIQPATLRGLVGFGDGQATGFSDLRDGQPMVTLYAAGGTTAQNNVFKFTFDGTPVTVTFVQSDGSTAIASGGSADLPLGPAGTTGTVINQINAAMVAAGITTPVTLGNLRQEGAGIRLVSKLSTSASSLIIGNGSTNTILGFTTGDRASRTAPTARRVASSLNNGINTAISEVIEDWDESTAITAEFASKGLAGIVKDAANAEYLCILSMASSGLGTSSSVTWAAASADSVLLQGTGFGVTAGEGSIGEAGISGFFVVSSDPADGSGTINNSVLNPANTGLGQDGVVGQTYRDRVTGLTFTLLGRAGGSNYPDGESWTLTVRPTATSNSNLPHNAIPGIELRVTNTLGVTAGDTAVVETYERGGSQPATGDVYYASYNYAKTDFDTRLFTKLSTVEATYGQINPGNPTTLAAYLAMLNGAVVVGINQVLKAPGSTQATVTAYRNAVDDLEGHLPGNIGVDILVSLRADSSDLYAYMARHADIQSSIRYRAERTVIGGLSAGTEPKAARTTAETIGATRVRLVYPDMATLTLTDAFNVDEEFIVGGEFMASAMVGAVVSPRRDVATPWTGMKLLGFNGLARTLDAVEQNRVAMSGLTVIEDRPPALRVRHGLTTDMSNVLTKTPTVMQIADEVQQQTRVTMERFIGIKFLPGVLSQIEGQMSNTLKLLVEAQIITAYTGVSANVASDDPTVAEVEAAYQPVFPLLYIIVNFSLRSSL